MITAASASASTSAAALPAAPTLFTPEHVLDVFDCGDPSFNEWLKRRALSNHMNGASRSYVLADKDGCVLGYYALAAGAVSHRDATSNERYAVQRTYAVASQGGLRALLVHAFNERAKAFYEGYGFTVSPTRALTLMLRLEMKT